MKERYFTEQKFGYAVSVVIEYILQNNRVDVLDELGDDAFGEAFADEVAYIRSRLMINNRLPTVNEFLLNFKDFQFIESLESIEAWITYLKEFRTFMVFYKLYDKVDKLIDAGNIDSAVSVYMSSFSKLAGTLDIKHKAVSDTEEMIKEMEEAEQGKVYIPTGLEGFDDKFEGFLVRGSDLSVIVARTGEGKTWLLLKMFLTALQKGYRAGFYSPEMPATEIQMRLQTWLGGFNFREMLGGKLSMEERERFLSFQDEWKQFNGFIYDDDSFRSAVTVADIDKIIRKNKLQVVYIDGFKYINDIKSSSYTSLTERMSNVARDLMALSKRHRIPIICTIQANRGGVEGNVPALEHIRDSDAVAHISTNVISIRNKFDKASASIKIELRVIKCRRNFIGDSFMYEAKFGKGELNYVGNGVGVVTRNSSKPRGVKEDHSNVSVYKGKIQTDDDGDEDYGF